MLVITFLLFSFYTIAVILAFKGYKVFKQALQDRVGVEAVDAHDKASNFLGYGTEAFKTNPASMNIGGSGAYSALP